MVRFFASCICFILVDCIVITNAQAPNWVTPSSNTAELDGANANSECDEVTQLVATSTDGSSVLYSLVSQTPDAGFAIVDDAISGNKILTCVGSSLTASSYTVVIRASHEGNGESADKTLTITVTGVTPATGPICSQGTSLSLDINDNTACDSVTSLTCTSTDSSSVSYSVTSGSPFGVSGTTLTCTIGDITETTYTVIVRAQNSGNSQTTDITFSITVSNSGSGGSGTGGSGSSSNGDNTGKIVGGVIGGVVGCGLVAAGVCFVVYKVVFIPKNVISGKGAKQPANGTEKSSEVLNSGSEEMPNGETVS